MFRQQMVKKRSIGLTIFGWLFLTLGLVAMIIPVLFFVKSQEILSLMTAVVGPEDTFLAKCLSYTQFIMLFLLLAWVFYSLVYMISGIGILRLRFWARYVVIVQVLSLIMGPFSNALLFGSQYLSPVVLVFLVAFISFVVWFFMREPIKKQFESEQARFSLKSKFGALIYAIIFLSLIIPIFVFGFKIYATMKWREPFFAAKPRAMELRAPGDSPLSEGYRRIELFNTSLLIPEGLLIRNLSKRENEWVCYMINPARSGDARGIEVLRLADTSMREIMMGLGKYMGFNNTHDFERALFTNNWSPIFALLRRMSSPGAELDEVAEFDSSGYSGFVRSTRYKTRVLYECSFYSKKGQGSRGVTIAYKSDSLFDESEAIDVFSSLEFLKQQKPQADKYYKEGLRFLESGDFNEAQFKFANAYYLRPDNPEHGYMLAKMLLENGRKDCSESFYHCAKEILEDVLELEPDYKNAKELLETIKSELSSSSKSATK